MMSSSALMRLNISGHRRTKDLMLVELDQLCQKLDQMIGWSCVNRPFDTAAYEHIFGIAQLAQGAVYSALRVCRILCKRTVHRRRKLAYP